MTIYPCGCSHLKVELGCCDIYAPDGTLRPEPVELPEQEDQPWPATITAFSMPWVLAHNDKSTALYESTPPYRPMFIRMVRHGGDFCAGLLGEDKQGMWDALEDLRSVIGVVRS